MVLGIPGGLETLVMSRESATLSALKARLTSRTSDELHLVAQLSGLSCPFLLDELEPVVWLKWAKRLVLV
jgi:hypothetical protein